jgi:hypothetical protein
MRRLYLQIYLTFLGVLLLFGLLVALAWWLIPGDGQDTRSLDGIALLLGDAVPVEPNRAGDKLAQLARVFGADLNLRAADGTLVATAGALLPAPELGRSGWMRGRGAGPTFAFKLPDGRWVVARTHQRHRPFGLLIALALMLVAIAVGSYPLVRRITGRLERLQARVEALGRAISPPACTSKAATRSRRSRAASTTRPSASRSSSVRTRPSSLTCRTSCVRPLPASAWRWSCSRAMHGPNCARVWRATSESWTR